MIEELVKQVNSLQKQVDALVKPEIASGVTTSHTHSKLVASDGLPDPAWDVDAAGNSSTAYNVTQTSTSVDIMPAGDTAGLDLRRRGWFGAPTDEFIAGAGGNGLGSGWGSWATNYGFSDPGAGVNYLTYKSLLWASFLSGNAPKGFLPRSTAVAALSNIVFKARLALYNLTNDSYVGIRVDSGTAATENAIELLVRQNSGNVDVLFRNTVAGTPTITSIKTLTWSPAFMGLYMTAGGTWYSDWYVLAYLFLDNPALEAISSLGGLTWQPARVGLTFYTNANPTGWYYAGLYDFAVSAI